MLRLLLSLAVLLFPWSSIHAAGDAPWGDAAVLDIQYKPAKVLYDLTSGDAKTLESVLDRASFLNTLYGADPFESSVIVIVHGDAIPFFVHKNFRRHEELMKRAHSLATGSPVEFRMCGAAARIMGYTAKDVHGFVKMVPMADAEIIRLQREEGYAYMQ
jgi:intracellular sulfur oxidation DsrE/DsrF family protein